MKAWEIINQIDEKLKEGKERGISRYSVEWGKWSHQMNKILKELTENEKDVLEKTKLKFAFAYWVTASQILELVYTKQFGHSLFLFYLYKELKDKKYFIRTGDKFWNEKI